MAYPARYDTRTGVIDLAPAPAPYWSWAWIQREASSIEHMGSLKGWGRYTDLYHVTIPFHGHGYFVCTEAEQKRCAS